MRQMQELYENYGVAPSLIAKQFGLKTETVKEYIKKWVRKTDAEEPEVGEPPSAPEEPVEPEEPAAVARPAENPTLFSAKVAPTNSMYNTTDIVQAAALVYLGYRLQDVKWFSPERATMQFAITAQLDEVIEDYRRGKLAVEPRAFWYAVRGIKSKIVDSQGSSGFSR